MSTSTGFLGVVKQLVKNEGVDVSDNAVNEGWAHWDASSGLAPASTQVRWRNMGIKKAGISALELVKAAEVFMSPSCLVLAVSVNGEEWNHSSVTTV
jgi:hypothetical protein